MHLVLAATRKEARQAVDLSPVYNSADEAVKQGGLSLDAIKQDYGQATINELLKWRPGLFTKKSTASPDSFATQFGFEGIDEMVMAWLDAPTKAEAADNIAEQLRRQYAEQEGMDLEIDVMNEEMTILASMLSKRKHKLPGIKKTIREQTGQVREENMVTETAALKAAFKKSAQAARKAFSEGNKKGVEAEKTRMKQIIGNYKDKIKQMREADKTIRLIKRTRKQLKKGTKNIAVEYQKKLAKVMGGVELSKSKYANLERVARGLKQVMGEYKE